MPANVKKFILRGLLIPVGGLFFVNELELITRAVNDIVFEFTYNLSGNPIFLTLNTRLDLVFAAFVGWQLTHLCFEAVAAFGKNFRFRRALSTLRYAPFAVFFTAATIVVLYDLAKIEYSKYEIRKYVFSASTSVQTPDIYLHNNYYGWRPSGYIEKERDLYFTTASAGIENENPSVRARSLMMTMRIEQWQSASDERFENILARSCADADSIVRATADGYLYRRRNSTCPKYLSNR